VFTFALFPTENQAKHGSVTGLNRDMATLYLDLTEINGVFDMKCKVMMMGLAMVSGLPNAVYAKSGNEVSAQAYPSWNTQYVPHYSAEWVSVPLMDPVSVASLPGQGISNAWRLEFAPPAAVSTADDPLSAEDKRVGFSLKLDF